jgi:polyisoprenoid-binding protein YceI
MLAACAPPAQTPVPAPPPQPAAVDAPSGQYSLDKNHSTLTVRVMHFGLQHYTLRFSGLDATLNFDAARPTQSSVTASVAANSVDAAYRGERDFNAELQNSQWLDAATHPAITFQSTGIELTSPNTGRMRGDLTIRGVTHPVIFEVTFNKGYRRHPMGLPAALLGFSAHATIKRSEYGLMVLQPPAGSDVGVADDVDIAIEAEFQQPIATNEPPPAAPREPTN